MINVVYDEYSLFLHVSLNLTAMIAPSIIPWIVFSFLIQVFKYRTVEVLIIVGAVVIIRRRILQAPNICKLKENELSNSDFTFSKASNSAYEEDFIEDST